MTRRHAFNCSLLFSCLPSKKTEDTERKMWEEWGLWPTKHRRKPSLCPVGAFHIWERQQGNLERGPGYTLPDHGSPAWTAGPDSKSKLLEGLPVSNQLRLSVYPLLLPRAVLHLLPNRALKKAPLKSSQGPLIPSSVPAARSKTVLPSF